MTFRRMSSGTLGCLLVLGLGAGVPVRGETTADIDASIERTESEQHAALQHCRQDRTRSLRPGRPASGGRCAAARHSGLILT